MALTRKSFKCFIIFSLCLIKISVAHERSKRDLRFPPGTSLSLGVALLSLYPKGPLSEGILQFVEVDLGYPMSEKVIFSKTEGEKKIDVAPGKWIKTKPKKKHLKDHKGGKTNSIEYEKRELLFKIQNAMIRLGYNGSACTLRLQCELRHISPESSLVEELIVELFKPSSATFIAQKDCETAALNCPISLLHIMLHSEQI